MTLRVLLVPILLAAAFLNLEGCASVPEEPPTYLYVALGSSETTGVGAYPITNGYAYKVRDEVQKHIPRAVFVNLGVPGGRVSQIYAQFKDETVLNFKPHLVTLFTGANDIVDGKDPEDFQTHLRRMLKALRKEPGTAIVIANLPDITQLPQFREAPRTNVTQERVRAFNAVIAREAVNAQVPVVDLYAEDLSDMLISDLDGFHPSNKGHGKLAKLFLEKVLPTIGVK